MPSASTALDCIEPSPRRDPANCGDGLRDGGIARPVLVLWWSFLCSVTAAVITFLPPGLSLIVLARLTALVFTLEVKATLVAAIFVAEDEGGRDGGPQGGNQVVAVGGLVGIVRADGEDDERGSQEQEAVVSVMQVVGRGRAGLRAEAYVELAVRVAAPSRVAATIGGCCCEEELTMTTVRWGCCCRLRFTRRRRRR